MAGFNRSEDAYFHISIHPDHYKFLRFTIGNHCYQYIVLPFGLTTSSRVFTMVLAFVMAYIIHKGIQVYPYLYDVLVVPGSSIQLVQDLDTTV